MGSAIAESAATNNKNSVVVLPLKLPEPKLAFFHPMRVFAAGCHLLARSAVLFLSDGTFEYCSP